MNNVPISHRSGALRVGIAGSLSGRRVAHSRAFTEACERLASAGVTAILGDDASTPESARALAESLVRDGVQAVVGHFNSACARAAAPVYRAAGVALLLPAASDTSLVVGQGVYRLCAHDATQARAIAQWVRTHHAKESALEVRVDGTEYGARMLQALQAELGSTIAAVARTTDDMPATASVCVVCAVAHNACDFVHRPDFARNRRTVLFTDDAAVGEFARASEGYRVECWVAMPTPSYEALLTLGADLVLQWGEEAKTSISLIDWLNRSDCFLPSGESAFSTWKLSRSTNCTYQASIHALTHPSQRQN